MSSLEKTKRQVSKETVETQFEPPFKKKWCCETLSLELATLREPFVRDMFRIDMRIC